MFQGIYQMVGLPGVQEYSGKKSEGLRKGSPETILSRMGLMGG